MAKKKVGKIHAILGRSRRTGRWRLGSNTSVVTSLGSCWLDLRQAQVDGSPVKMTALVILGDLTIVVPPGIEVRPSGTSVLGSAWINVPLASGKSQLKLIEFEWTTVFGRIRVSSYDQIEITNLRNRLPKRAKGDKAVKVNTLAQSPTETLDEPALPVSDEAKEEPATPPPAIGFEDLEDEPATPPPAIGFEDLEDEPATPPPAVGFEDLEDEPATPPPAVGFEDLEDEPATPPPAVGFEDLEDEPATPPPAVGFEDLEDEPATPPPAIGFEDLEASAPDSPAGLESSDRRAGKSDEESEEPAEPTPPPAAVGFEDL